jgi:multidrug efflux system outer membrane protein
MKRVLLLALAAALAACAGPRPRTPPEAAVAPPPGWRGETAPGSQVEAQWWTAFGDPALTRLVAEALQHNDDIALAATRVAQARAAFKLSRAQRLPDLNGEFLAGRDRDVNPGFGFPEVQNYGGAEAAASFDVDLFGRLAKASEAARAALLASRYGRDAVRLAVAASTAQGYIGLRALDARLQVLNDTLAFREQALKLAQRRAETGYASQLDLHQAEAEYQATRELIPAAELAITRQEDGLNLLLGRPPGDVVRGLDLHDLKPPRADAGTPARLLRRRPDVAAAEQQVVAADRSLDSVRAAFLPDIQLTADGGAVESSLILQNPTGIYTLQGALLGPIFDAGRLRAQQGAAAARRDEAAFQYRKTALTAFKEVEDALAAERRSAEQEEALAAERDAFAKTLGQAMHRYREGYSPYLEQLEAERSLLSAELALVQSRADRLDAAVALFEALGGGWTPGQAGGVR